MRRINYNLLIYILTILFTVTLANESFSADRIRVQVNKAGQYLVDAPAKPVYKTTLRLLGGLAHSKMYCSSSVTSFECSQDYKTTVGVGIEQDLTNRFNVGVYFFNNSDKFIGIGIKF